MKSRRGPEVSVANVPPRDSLETHPGGSYALNPGSPGDEVEVVEGRPVAATSVDQGDEGVEVDRLDEVVVDPGRQGSAPVLLTAVARDRDEDRVAAPGFLSEP